MLGGGRGTPIVRMTVPLTMRVIGMARVEMDGTGVLGELEGTKKVMR